VGQDRRVSLAAREHGKMVGPAEQGLRALTALGPLAVLAAVAAGVVVTAFAFGGVAGAGTTHAGSSPIEFVVSVATATALLVSGTVAWLRSASRVLGGTVLALAATWAAPTWVGWSTGPTLLRSLGEVAAPLAVPVVVHLCLLGPSGRIESATGRRLTATVWAMASLVTVLRAAIRDPLLDLTCWSNCTDNVFLVHPAPRAARLLDTGWQVSAAGICLLAAGIATLSGRRPGRPTATGHPVRPAAAAVALVLAGWLATRAAGVPEMAGSQPYRVLHLLAAATFIGVAAATGWEVVRTERLGRRLDRLAHELAAAPRPGTLRNWLADILDDPCLVVSYRRPDTGTLVDATGSPTTAGVAPGQTAVPVGRGSDEVAVIVHGRGAAGTSLLQARLGAAARLAIDNERLRAELLAQLRELQLSRARLVAAGDVERRRLERDLHDGAQQRLLAALHALDRAAGASGDKPELRELVRHAEALLEELRRLAHGIFPAVVEHAGLLSALESLAETAPVPVLVEGDDGKVPLNAGVSRAAYAMADAIVAGAPTDTHTVLVLRVAGFEDHLVVEAAGAGVGSAAAPEVPGASWRDRVEALGGRLSVSPDRVRVELPCG
jgi:signal transduction histidine kinase